MFNELVEENSGNIYFDETMIFFSASFTQAFSSRLKFVLRFFGSLRFRLNWNIAVKFCDSQIRFYGDLSTLTWSNGHRQYSSNHPFCPRPSAPSASTSSPSHQQCVLYPFYSCYGVYLSFHLVYDLSMTISHSWFAVSQILTLQSPTS